jgi:polysaccharide export outer membrane protein
MRYRHMKSGLLITICFVIFFPALLWGGGYLICESDTLEISVWGEKDLKVSVKVMPDGMITMPAVGEVAVSGITVVDLQKLLSERLKDYVKNPNVTVNVREITNNKVYIIGSGVRPGVYELTKRTTLLQLLSLIGQTEAKSADPQTFLRSADLKK